jgi:hypothetical protein
MAVSKREKTKYFVFQVFEYVEIEGLYADTCKREVECFPDELLTELKKIPLVRVEDGKATLCVEMVVISALTHEVVHHRRLIPQTRNSFSPEYEINPRYDIQGRHSSGKVKKQAYLLFKVSQCLGERGYYTGSSMSRFHCPRKDLETEIESIKLNCFRNPLEVWVECYTIDSKGNLVQVHMKNVEGIFEKIKESRMKQKYIALRIWRGKRDERDYPETEIMQFECLPEEVLMKLKPPADKRKDFEKGSHAELILIGPGHVIEQFRH